VRDSHPVAGERRGRSAAGNLGVMWDGRGVASGCRTGVRVAADCVVGSGAGRSCSGHIGRFLSVGFVVCWRRWRKHRNEYASRFSSRLEIGAAAWGGVSDCSVVSIGSLCVTVGPEGHSNDAGRIGVSTNPAGGPGAWRVVPVGAAKEPWGISCPSVSLCVGVDFHGNGFSSVDPTGGANAWRVVHVDRAGGPIGLAEFLGVSCPSVSLCVATDDDGNVLTSTDPAGGVGTWRVTHFKAPFGLGTPSCLSPTLCIAAYPGVVLSSTNPAGGPGAWSLANVDAASFPVSVACASVSICFIGNDDGTVARSTRPTAGAGSWTNTRIDGNDLLNAISCPSSNLCLAVDDAGNVVVGAPALIRVRVPRVIVTHNPMFVRAHRHGREWRVDPGEAVTCPPRGASCSVTGDVADLDANTSKGPLEIGRVHATIHAGGRREITFNLTTRGTRLMIKHHGMLASLNIIAQAAHGKEVASQPTFELLPPRATPY
jgi:hypothetical protein